MSRSALLLASIAALFASVLALSARAPAGSRTPAPSFSPFLPSRRSPAIRCSGFRTATSLIPRCAEAAGAVHGDEVVAADGCGPSSFDDAIATRATGVRPGDAFVLVDGADWQLGTDPAIVERWFVRVMRSGVAGMDEPHGTLADGVGRTLKAGTGRHPTVGIASPTAPGDYLVQFDGGITRDAWSVAMAPGTGTSASGRRERAGGRRHTPTR